MGFGSYQHSDGGRERWAMVFFPFLLSELRGLGFASEQVGSGAEGVWWVWGSWAHSVRRGVTKLAGRGSRLWGRAAAVHTAEDVAGSLTPLSLGMWQAAQGMMSPTIFPAPSLGSEAV